MLKAFTANYHSIRDHHSRNQCLLFPERARDSVGKIASEQHMDVMGHMAAVVRRSSFPGSRTIRTLLSQVESCSFTGG